MSLAIMSVLVMGLASAVVVSARAMPAADDPEDQALDAAAVVDRIAAELAWATSIATEIVFTVDRGGSTHEIRYAWSGTPGDPVQRQFDGGTLVDVADGAQDFQFDLDAVAPPTDPGPPPVIEGPEEVFLVQDSSNSGNAAEVSVNGLTRFAVSFRPALPADAVSWRITRIQVTVSPQPKREGTLEIAIKPATTTGEPAGPAVDTVLIAEADLGNNVWRDIPFADAGGLDPAIPVAITFDAPGQVYVAAHLKIGTSSTGSPETRYLTYDMGAGGPWVEDPSRDVWIWVYGTVSTPDPVPPPPALSIVRGVTVRLLPSPAPETVARATALLLNRPEASIL